MYSKWYIALSLETTNLHEYLSMVQPATRCTNMMYSTPDIRQLNNASAYEYKDGIEGRNINYYRRDVT